MTERLIVSVTTKPRRTRSGRIRFTDANGMGHDYLNVEVPHGQPLIASLCDRCKYGYAENIINGTHLCSECKVEEVMDAAAALEAEGIEMGAGTMGQHADYERERQRFRGAIPAPLR